MRDPYKTLYEGVIVINDISFGNFVFGANECMADAESPVASFFGFQNPEELCAAFGITEEEFKKKAILKDEYQNLPLDVLKRYGLYFENVQIPANMPTWHQVRLGLVHQSIFQRWMDAGTTFVIPPNPKYPSVTDNRCKNPICSEIYFFTLEQIKNIREKLLSSKGEECPFVNALIGSMHNIEVSFKKKMGVSAKFLFWKVDIEMINTL